MLRSGIGKALSSLLLSQLILGSVEAAESVSPYIDELKSQMEDPGGLEPSTESYTESEKAKLPEKSTYNPQTGDSQPYIDQLKEANPALQAKPGSGSFIEDKKAVLGPDTASGGAIQALNEGRSKLELKRPGKIDFGVGFKIGAAVSRDITAASAVQANSFESVYGSGWAPDLNLTAEYKPFYSENYGSLGIIGSAGFSYYKGMGQFGVTLTNPVTSAAFPSTSRTKMTFVSVPVSLGLRYQFNFSNYLRPYALVAPTVVGYTETRNDGKDSFKGYSKGLTTTAGVAILLDWISPANSWDMYQVFSIKHYYLTVEYSKLTSISSDVDFSFSGLNAGFTFEF